jgi:hypothetical protein
VSDVGGADHGHDEATGEPVDGAVVVDDPEGSEHPPTSDPPEATDEGRGWRGWLWLLPWILLALAIAATVALAVQVQELRAEESAREDVERVAGTFMLTLTTWDGTQDMSETREELRAAGTERFAGEVDELFGTTEDLAGLAEIGARSEGDVRRSFVQEIEGDQATALIVVVQRLSSDLTDEDEVAVRYAEIELLERDGQWRVDDVELLVDVTQQEPGGTVTPDEGPSDSDEEPDDADGDEGEGEDD